MEVHEALSAVAAIAKREIKGTVYRGFALAGATAGGVVVVYLVLVEVIR